MQPFKILRGTQQDSVVSSAYLMTFNKHPGFLFLPFWFNQLLFLSGRDCWLIFLFCLRNPQDWSDGWQNLAARQHQPDRLLPCELWPPELETADSTAAHQPSSMSDCLSFLCLLSWQPLFLFNSVSALFFVIFLLPLCLSDHLHWKQGRTHRRCLQPGKVSLLFYQKTFWLSLV